MVRSRELTVGFRHRASCLMMQLGFGFVRAPRRFVFLLSNLVTGLAWPRRGMCQRPDTFRQRAQFVSLKARLKVAVEVPYAPVLSESPLIGILATSWYPVAPKWLSVAHGARYLSSGQVTLERWYTLFLVLCLPVYVVERYTGGDGFERP